SSAAGQGVHKRNGCSVRQTLSPDRRCDHGETECACGREFAAPGEPSGKYRDWKRIGDSGWRAHAQWDGGTSWPAEYVQLRLGQIEARLPVNRKDGQAIFLTADESYCLGLQTRRIKRQTRR